MDPPKLPMNTNAEFTTDNACGVNEVMVVELAVNTVSVVVEEKPLVVLNTTLFAPYTYMMDALAA